MMAGYRVDNVPMPGSPPWGRSPNPLTVALRQIAVGQSILVPPGDPNWKTRHLANLNADKAKHFFMVREPGGIRIFRDK
jgi:hypothetical protein